MIEVTVEIIDSVLEVTAELPRIGLTIDTIDGGNASTVFDFTITDL